MSGKRTLFGTDGVRGTANVHPMTASMALRLGQAAAYVFRGRRDGGRRFLIGKDTRLSGYMFEDALAAGISSMGGTVIQVGPMPTPALAFLTVDMRCDAGVMITASHNPYQDNGIKFFGSDGFKLDDAIEHRIEELVSSDEIAGFLAPPDEVGPARRIDDAAGRTLAPGRSRTAGRARTSPRAPSAAASKPVGHSRMTARPRPRTAAPRGPAL